MGLFDSIFGKDEDAHEVAYREGEHEAANESVPEGMLHDVTDIIPTPFDKTTEEQSHEAGYHDKRGS